MQCTQDKVTDYLEQRFYINKVIRKKPKKKIQASHPGDRQNQEPV